MKTAHYNKETKKLLGWYDKEINNKIPTPNIEVTNEVWKLAINENANYVDVANKTFSVKDFRTADEIEAELLEAEIYNRKNNGEDYSLNGTDYKVPFTKNDGDAIMQVNAGFQIGLVETKVHFSNGTIMPIKATEFQEFAVWFVNKRNSFFI